MCIIGMPHHHHGKRIASWSLDGSWLLSNLAPWLQGRGAAPSQALLSPQPADSPPLLPRLADLPLFFLTPAARSHPSRPALSSFSKHSVLLLPPLPVPFFCILSFLLLNTQISSPRSVPKSCRPPCCCQVSRTTLRTNVSKPQLRRISTHSIPRLPDRWPRTPDPQVVLLTGVCSNLNLGTCKWRRNFKTRLRY